MNIDHLNLFVRVAALNNISMAGKELGLSPAVSSAHINKLEDTLGVRLIHRTTRKVSLTQEGQAFLPHAREVLESMETARAAVGAGSRSPHGKLRVAAPASFGRMHLVPALDAFLNQYPDVKLDLQLSDKIIDMVEGGYDVAIRDATLNDSTLIAKKLANDKRIICASPKYIERYGRPTSPPDLANHHCVNLSGLTTWQFETEEGPVSVKTNNRMLTDNGEAARDACVEGIGLTLCSLWCCYKHLQNGQLVPVLTDYPLAAEPAIWAVYPSSRLLAPKVRSFIDFFATCFDGTPYWEKQA